MRTNLIAGLLLATSSAAFAQSTVSLNEIRVQQSGVDSQIYVEVAGAAGTDMSAYTLLVIGNVDFATAPLQNGSIETVIPLSGTIGASGFFVVADYGFTINTPDMYTFMDLYSDNNKTYMLVKDFSGFIDDDIDDNDDGTMNAVLPWSSIDSSVALIAYSPADGQFNDFVYSAQSVGPDGGAFPSMVYKCSDSGAWRLGFAEVTPTSDTPGATNPACTSEAVVQINEIRNAQLGNNSDEYTELAGAAGTSLDGLTYLVIGDGSGTSKSGVVEMALSLTGKTIPSNGLFLITGASSTFNSAADGISFGKTGDFVVPAGTGFNFENSDHTTHLLVRGYTGAVFTSQSNGPDLDTGVDDGILNVTPWTKVLDSVGLVKVAATGPVLDGTRGEWTYQVTNADGGLTPMVGPDGINLPSHIYRCSPQGSWKIGYFDPTAAGSNNKDTPKAVNPACSTCGEVGSGSCFVTHGGPGCDSASCCATVCSVVPACCLTAWDSLCTDASTTYCLQGGSPPAIALSEMRTSDEATRFETTQVNQYLEITGTPNASLNGVSLVFIQEAYSDARGLVSAVVKLDGLQLDDAGQFLITETGFNIPGVTGNMQTTGSLPFYTTGTNTIGLFWNFYGARNDDLDSDNDGVFNTTPYGSIIDSISLTDGTTTGFAYSSTVVGPHNTGGNDRVPEHVYRCASAGTWTMGASSVTTGYDTPRGVNADCSKPQIFGCGDSGAGDCFSAHSTAHCFNMACCDAVCQVAPDCCGVAWDALCVDAAGTLTACGGGSPTAYLNEVRFDESTAGGDINEYVEIKAPAGTSLDGLTLIVIGDGTLKSGVIECIVPLTGKVVGDSGYFLVTVLAPTQTPPQDGIALGVAGDLQVATLILENTDNVTVALVKDFTGTSQADVDSDDNGTFNDVLPWSSIVDMVSIVKTYLPAPTGSNEWWYGARVGPNASGLAWHIYRCNSIGYWQTGAREIVDPLLTTDTPGAQNLDCPGGIVNLCPTDLNGDSVTDSSDMGSLLGSFGTCEPGTPGDFNDDLVIDSSDLGSMLGSFGPCPTE